MTDYVSSSYRPSVVPVVPGDLHDFRLLDSYVISQDITALQAEARVLPYTTHPPVDTLDGGLSWTGVMDALEKTPQSHAKGRSDAPRVPVGYVVMLYLGIVLVGAALVGLWIAPLIREG